MTTVLDRVRERSGTDSQARVVSENDFESNVGLGASASAFAALALAATEAAGLDLPRRELSRLVRHGATSATRSVTEGFSHLHANAAAEDCVAAPVPGGYDEDIRIVVGLVPEYKRTSRARAETPAVTPLPRSDSRTSSEVGSRTHTERWPTWARRFGTGISSRRSNSPNVTRSILAVTMTGPEGWIYWQPETLELPGLARRLRETGVPVYFSSDTGATAYLNTTAEYAEEVSEEVEALGIAARTWHVGGEVERTDTHLFE